MIACRQYILGILLVLLLTACGAPRGNRAVNMSAAQLSTHAQSATPVVIHTVTSALPSTSATSVLTADGTPKNPSDTCPVTAPPNPPFTPPAPYSPSAPGGGEFWYGTDSLWTAVRYNGAWSDLPHNPEGYTQKVFWWRKDYSWTAEPEPQLTVTGRRLDASAAPLNVSRASNAFAEDIQSAMLVGVDFPTLGCWEITGQYANTKLSFVVWVAP